MNQPETKTTRITKPAGCAMQVIGFALVALSLALFAGEMIVAGLAALAIGVWLIILGRRPAVRRRLN